MEHHNSSSILSTNREIFHLSICQKTKASQRPHTGNQKDLGRSYNSPGALMKVVVVSSHWNYNLLSPTD